MYLALGLQNRPETWLTPAEPQSLLRRNASLFSDSGGKQGPILERGAGLWLGGRCELGTMPEVRRAYPFTLSWSALTCSPLQTFFDVHGFAGPAQNGSVASNPRGSHAAEHR
jgi:hypothetical protein